MKIQSEIFTFGLKARSSSRGYSYLETLILDQIGNGTCVMMYRNIAWGTVYYLNTGPISLTLDG